MTRREAVAAAAAGMTIATQASARPAVLGGEPVRKKPFPSWPISGPPEKNALSAVLDSGKWFRGRGPVNSDFEGRFARLMGAKGALAVANGTSALMTALHGLDVQAGDEVIVPPYTFIATINAVLSKGALPVFVDTDPATFQIDASKIAAAVTGRTVAVVPVHIAGSPADLDAVLAVAKEKNLKVLEDAAQAHLAEWKGRRVGTWGDAGTFSFQASKNLTAGEGGAVITNDEALLARCYAYHTNSGPASDAMGANLRMTEFQAALLIAQMQRLEAQARRRDENAALLTKLLGAIDGIQPAALHPGTTRSAWHLYMFRYDASRFAGLSRAAFLKALSAEGVPASSGYTRLNHQPFLANTFAGRGYQRIYGADRLRQWKEQNVTPVNDRLTEEAVWFGQTVLLGEAADMRDIAEAIGKIKQHAAEIAKG